MICNTLVSVPDGTKPVAIWYQTGTRRVPDWYHTDTKFYQTATSILMWPPASGHGIYIYIYIYIDPTPPHHVGLGWVGWLGSMIILDVHRYIYIYIYIYILYTYIQIHNYSADWSVRIRNLAGWVHQRSKLFLPARKHGTSKRIRPDGYQTGTRLVPG